MIEAITNWIERRRFHIGFARRFAGSRIVLSAGMPRSGSTWLYNVIRLLLGAQIGRENLGCGWLGDWRQSSPNRTMLFKTHEFDAQLADIAKLHVYSFRDVRDALASNQRMFGAVPSLELARRWIDQDQQWRDRAGFVMRYESMRQDPRTTLLQCAEFLEISKFCPDEIISAMDVLTEKQLECPTDYDLVTLLHANHITDGRHGTWQTSLPAQLAQQIDSEFGWWLRENDYPLLDTLSRGSFAAEREPQWGWGRQHGIHNKIP